MGIIRTFLNRIVNTPVMLITWARANFQWNCKEQFKNMLRFVSSPPTKYLFCQHWMTDIEFLHHMIQNQNQYRELHSVHFPHLVH